MTLYPLVDPNTHQSINNQSKETKLNDEALLLTTLDNPFNPFTNFSEWKEFDENKGYFTCNLLGRMSFTSSELNEEQNKRLQKHRNQRYR